MSEKYQKKYLIYISASEFRRTPWATAQRIAVSRGQRLKIIFGGVGEKAMSPVCRTPPKITF